MSGQYPYPDYSGALLSGVKGFMLGKQIKQDREDREIKLTQNKEDRNRQGLTQSREDEEYKHKQSRRTKEDTLFDAGYQSKIDALNKEGYIDALRLLDAGQHDKAADYYNRYGESKVRRFTPHPDGKGLIVAEADDGSQFVVNPREQLLALTRDYSKTGDKLKANEFYDNRGTLMTSKAMEDEYIAQNMIVGQFGEKTLREGAPDYITWHNARVPPAVQIHAPGGQGLTQQDQALTPEELDRARVGLNTADGGDRANDWIPFNEPSDDQVRARAYEGRGQSLTGGLPPNPGGGQTARGQVIRDQNLSRALEAISAGKDPAAVRQRLLEAGYREDQLQAAGIR